MVRANELTEEVVIVGRLAVDGIQVLDDVVRFVIRVGVLDDLRSIRVFMRDRRDGVNKSRCSPPPLVQKVGGITRRIC